MAGHLALNWRVLRFKAHGIASWKTLKAKVDLSEHPLLFSKRAVYVIRVRRPFSFDYGVKHSPVAYIGKGQAQQRITSHLQRWVPDLANKMPDLRLEIYYCEPRLPKLGTVCEGVEADLIRRFIEVYGRRPLRNLNTPSDPYQRTYTADSMRVLHPMKGGGYHWALRPLPSSPFY